MIAKAKAIAHGGRAIEYAMRESKEGEFINMNLIQNETPDAIFREFLETQKYNTRCKNKFIRIEIGIAPQDEKKLSNEDFQKICSSFSQKFGFKNHQWIACTHRDTDNLHLHMIVNRISIDNKVYNTDFISMRAGKIAEEISREMGLTIAKEVERKEKYRLEVTSFERMLIRSKIELTAKTVLKSHPKSFKEFADEMKKRNVTVTEAKNKKGNTYGLRFSGFGQTFKASQIGKEFGYRTLMASFTEGTKNQQNIQVNNQPTVVENITSGIGSLLDVGSALGALLPDGQSSHNPDEDYQELLKRKRKKKKGYGRQH